jgi:3-oxoacyl-[acyl-carrier-protein] synthase II
MLQPKSLRRVAITGLGCVTPIGLGKDHFWSSIKSGQSGCGTIAKFDASDLPVRIAAQVKGFDPDIYIAAKDRQHVSDAVAFAIGAADRAFDDAGLTPRDMPLDERREIGVILGSGGASLSSSSDSIATTSRMRRKRPASIPFRQPRPVRWQAKSRWPSGCVASIT